MLTHSSFIPKIILTNSLQPQTTIVVYQVFQYGVHAIKDRQIIITYIQNVIPWRLIIVSNDRRMKLLEQIASAKNIMDLEKSYWSNHAFEPAGRVDPSAITTSTKSSSFLEPVYLSKETLV